MVNQISNINSREQKYQKPTFLLLLICGYIFLTIDRPWESISWLQGVRIERYYAIFMILVALVQNRLTLVKTPTNKWVFGLLSLHFVLAPFAFSPSFAIDQGIEYTKMVVLYSLMLAIADDEKTLKLLLTAFIFSMFFYVLHSLWEFYNGRHVYRMGIVRMIGTDQSWSDPNSFGASMVLSLPFVYVFVRLEVNRWIRWIYYTYFLIVISCIVLTGSRTAFVAMFVAFLILILKQKGERLIAGMIIAVITCGILWIAMPEDKQVRIRTLWDKDAGPANAHESAKGRLEGLNASWKMFKQVPFTGVGAGGRNFIGYRINNGIDDAAFQSHILYGEVLAEFGILGVFFFVGLVVCIYRCCTISINQFAFAGAKDTFLHAIGGACIACLLLLLVFGIGGHNFYRPMWLWIAAWSGSLVRLSNNYEFKN